MNDRELLEMAAKAAGISYDEPECDCGDCWKFFWNPLRDDGDALRLAVKLCLDVNQYRESGDKSACLFASGISHRCIEHSGDDPYAATRRAIVRAAAEIGKAMP